MIETCRCAPRLTSSWFTYEPYVSPPNTTFEPSGIMPFILKDLVLTCCQTCKTNGYSYIDFSRDGQNNNAQQNNEHQLKLKFDNSTDFYFPIYGQKGKHWRRQRGLVVSVLELHADVPGSNLTLTIVLICLG